MVFTIQAETATWGKLCKLRQRKLQLADSPVPKITHYAYTSSGINMVCEASDIRKVFRTGHLRVRFQLFMEHVIHDTCRCRCTFNYLEACFRGTRLYANLIPVK